MRSQCTFWCSVLSDECNEHWCMTLIKPSQCTFWCSVLSDLLRINLQQRKASSLNAPSGAQCFPTRIWTWTCLTTTRLNAPSGAQCFPTETIKLDGDADVVSMHLLVLSVFRLSAHGSPNAPTESQCTFWCPVLSDPKSDVLNIDAYRGLNAPSGAQCFPTRLGDAPAPRNPLSQCTFWCSVLSDNRRHAPMNGHRRQVSMHLLVLSAFRPERKLS